MNGYLRLKLGILVLSRGKTLGSIVVGIIFLFISITGVSAQEQTQRDSLVAGDTVVRQNIAQNLKTGIIPGLAQYKHKQYWKVPIYPAGIGGMVMGGLYHHNQISQLKSQSEQILAGQFPYSYKHVADRPEFKSNIDQIKDHRLKRNLFFAGAGMLYMLNMADAIQPLYKEYHVPYKAWLYSAFVPGLGQAYNGDYWKIPLVYAGFATFAYFINYNHQNYLKYKRAYLLRFYYKGNEDMLRFVDNEIAKMDWISDNRLKEEKNRWQRYRDLNIVGAVAFYGITIIDALAFSYMYDYNVSDELSVKVRPAYMVQNGIGHLGIRCNINL